LTTVPLTLDRDAPGPLGRQLSARIRDLVVAGTLGRGDRLPSSRALARELAVSRSVTEQAYDQLVAEGWLEARRGSGTYVAAGAAAGRGATALPRPADTPALTWLDAGTPWIDPRHAAGWRRAWREVSTARPPRGYEDPRGIPELRAAVAERLGRTRGLPVDPDEVAITCGTTDGLRHLVAALPDGPVAIEDPGYRAAVETVRATGRPVRDLPALEPVADLTGTAAAYVTPAHQHPLGRVMPAADRLTLLAAATAAGALVVEDDYDSEFRCGSAGWSLPRPSRTGCTPAAASPTTPRPGRCSGRSWRCCGTGTSTGWSARPAGSTPSGRRGSRPRSRRTPSRRGRSPACTPPGCFPGRPPSPRSGRPGTPASG
jgi:GntR family transcriptional regulator/MocR family aminotransferase